MIKNICLAIMARNEVSMLERRFGDSVFDAKVATAYDDGTLETLARMGFYAVIQKWTGSFSEARMQLLALAKRTGLPWVLMLDADEMMYPNDAQVLSKICEQVTMAPVITLPRYNLMDDGSVVDMTNYPDQQARVLSLRANLEFRNNVHEVLYESNQKECVTAQARHVFLGGLHIYHYGGCRSLPHQWLRSENYRRMQRGEPVADRYPPELDTMTRQEWLAEVGKTHRLEPFNQLHPLYGTDIHP